MKATTLTTAAILPLAFLVSCTQNSTTAQPGANPYPPQTANPYGVPGQSDVGQYTPDATPHQPVQPINPPALPSGSPTPPALPNQGYVPQPTFPHSTPQQVRPNVSGNSHTVVKGDSLWGISRKYGISIDSLRQANGMAADDTNIRTGAVLQIPRR